MDQTLSHTEENYLKALTHLTILDQNSLGVGTNDLAHNLGLKPATVNDMLKKLKEKKLVNYQKYGKITLTENGRKSGVEIIRKHRLWETFLCEKLEFSWDEVHEVAEQLEHIRSGKLVNRLDRFLDYPKFDPHGDPIPNEKGEIEFRQRKLLSELKVGDTCSLMAVKDNDPDFLKYVDKLGLSIGAAIEVMGIENYDNSMQILVNNSQFNISEKVAENLYVS